MAEFKLNEEQKELMKKFSDDVNELKEKYSNMNKAFETIRKNIATKLNSCDDERLEEVKKETETLQRQTSNVIEKLGRINYLANGYDGYKNPTSLLLAVKSLISEAMYELGKLEGYSSGEIHTYSDTFVFARNYAALEKSLLGE